MLRQTERRLEADSVRAERELVEAKVRVRATLRAERKALLERLREVEEKLGLPRGTRTHRVTRGQGEAKALVMQAIAAATAPISSAQLAAVTGLSTHHVENILARARAFGAVTVTKSDIGRRRYSTAPAAEAKCAAE